MTLELLAKYAPLFLATAAILVGGTCWVVWASFVLRGLREVMVQWSARIDGHRHDDEGAVYYPARSAPATAGPGMADRPG